MGEAIFFYIFAGVTIVMALLMIFQVNPVSSALCLVFSFFGLAALYVLLEAPFVAVLQVLVYGGAIMVLFVFVIMLFKLRPEDLIQDRVRADKKIASLFVIGIAYLASREFFVSKMEAMPFGDLSPNFGSAESVGHLMFTKYLIPFELTSILILVAIIGAVMLGKKT